MCTPNVAAGHRSRIDSHSLSEINVTPFVDVALVLLIIFMITAHAMDSGIEVDVPRTKTVSTSTKELPIVTITKSGGLYLGKDGINLNNLVASLHRQYPGQTVVYVKTDRLTTMEMGLQVMSVLDADKFGVKLVSELDTKATAKR